MARACHRDTCPVGVATQRLDLREKFAGTPDTVAAYLVMVAEEVRELLAAAGFRSLGTAGRGPGRLDALSTTTVYAVPEEEVRAEWVAAVLGAPMLPLPEGFAAPLGAQVVVAVGDDASS